MVADIVILSDNLFEVDPENIKNVEVLHTMIDGKLIFSK
jgi:predicted amidohydrolase YtcJ